MKVEELKLAQPLTINGMNTHHINVGRADYKGLSIWFDEERQIIQIMGDRSGKIYYLGLPNVVYMCGEREDKKELPKRREITVQKGIKTPTQA